MKNIFKTLLDQEMQDAVTSFSLHPCVSLCQSAIACCTHIIRTDPLKVPCTAVYAQVCAPLSNWSIQPMQQTHQNKPLCKSQCYCWFHEKWNPSGKRDERDWRWGMSEVEWGDGLCSSDSEWALIWGSFLPNLPGSCTKEERRGKCTIELHEVWPCSWAWDTSASFAACAKVLLVKSWELHCLIRSWKTGQGLSLSTVSSWHFQSS